ncbi:MAG: hypothetical protein ACJ8R9_17925 [Steroidobacteraceae bacterium]
MSKISVFSRAHRALRDASRFQFASTESDITERYREQIRVYAPLGQIVGLYKNPDAVQPEGILVTENGLLAIRPGSSQWITFAELESVRGPNAESESSDILLTLHSGIVVGLRVAGRDDRFRDVFGFARFLDRVLGDRN